MLQCCVNSAQIKLHRVESSVGGGEVATNGGIFLAFVTDYRSVCSQVFGLVLLAFCSD